VNMKSREQIVFQELPTEIWHNQRPVGQATCEINRRRQQGKDWKHRVYAPL